MAHRFYVKELGNSDRVRLAGETVRHLHVLGLSTGSEVVLFDGTGWEFHAQIESISRSSAEARILRRSEISREAALDLTIACAVPKGRRMDTLVRMCSELGIRRIVPLVTGRSVVKPTGRKGASHKLDRWRKIGEAASEQCGRNLITTIDPPTRFAELLDHADVFDLAVILSPDDAAPSLADLLEEHSGLASLLILVGPEGGFTSEEMELAGARGAQPAKLTRSTLRVETACVAAAAVALILR